MPKGGRGGKRRGGGNGGGSWSNSPNPYQIPATVSEAIGPKGEERSMADAWFESNPNYNETYSEFQENCQRCVFAYELRRRGYDVEALPTYKGDMMPRSINWMQAMSGMERVNVGRTTENATIKAIESQMAKWGEGSRAIIRLKWAGAPGRGHVANLEYKNGKLHVYDTQIARSDKQLSTGVKYLRENLPYTTLSHTELLRTDNATIADSMRYMVKRK